MGRLLEWFNAQRTRTKWIVGGIAVLLVLGIIGALLPEEQPTTTSPSRPVTTSGRTTAATPASRPASKTEIEEQRKGFHCLSKWDGNHDGMERLIRAELNDPGSMETHSTKIAPVQDGIHAVVVDFSAKNAYGGMVRQEAQGFVDHDTCEATLWAIE